MSTINSPIRMDLPLAPSIDEPELFNELLTVYSAMRALHAASSTALVLEAASDEEIQAAELLTFYTLNNQARIIATAGEAITAGKFVEAYDVSGALYVRKTRFHSGAPYSTNCLGVTVSDAAAGDKIVIYVKPAIIVGFSGLTPGVPYYTYDDGQFTNLTLFPVVGAPTLFTGGNLCGIALNTTTMMLRTFDPT